jgi:hypothetical protein
VVSLTHAHAPAQLLASYLQFSNVFIGAPNHCSDGLTPVWRDERGEVRQTQITSETEKDKDKEAKENAKERRLQFLQLFPLVESKRSLKASHSAAGSPAEAPVHDAATRAAHWPKRQTTATGRRHLRIHLDKRRCRFYAYGTAWRACAAPPRVFVVGYIRRVQRRPTHSDTRGQAPFTGWCNSNPKVAWHAP